MFLPNNTDLTDKVAIVTGGTGVLGSVWVEALAEAGAKVAIIGREKARLEDQVKSLEAAGKKVLGIQADVLDKASLKKAHEEILEGLGKCDILVNGAGGNHPKGTSVREYMEEEDLTRDDLNFFNLDEEGIRFVFDLNFLGTFLACQEFVQDMVGREGCSVINISSMNAFSPLTKIPAYSAAKASVSNFTQWLAVHLSKVGVRVNAMAPGFFLTQQNEKLLLNEDGSFTERSNKIINNTPMERFGKPEELVGTLLFLANDKASGFINGVVIPIDGGFSAYSGV